MMKTAILNFPKQFAFKPKVVNGEKLKRFKKFAVAGMGGSQLPSYLLRTWNPGLDIIDNRDYGWPALAEKNAKERLFIVSSYSGNTEETIDAFNRALAKKYALAAVATGGKLLEIARALANSMVDADPDIFLLDEPFAGLFPHMIKIVESIVKELKEQGKTIILIEHNMNLIRELCDYVFVMDEGRLLAEGEPDKVLEERKVIEAYLGE